MKNFTEALKKVIPGGCHTYSRGWDQFPSNAPQILSRGKGAYVFDQNEKKFLDYGMGLRSVILGYSDSRIDNRVADSIKRGNNLTLPSMLELEAAEQFVDFLGWPDMVKFAKSGSSVTTAAIKLARANTGRDIVCVPSNQPFFSFDDWFIGSTPMNRGIPEELKALTVQFEYGDIDSLQKCFDLYPHRIAAVIMEPATAQLPCNNCPAVLLGEDSACCSNSGADNFLKRAAALIRLNGALFIADEMITGFRYRAGGAAHHFGVTPDLSTFGKAIGNGFSVSALVGTRSVMQVGSTDLEGLERTFLLSSTHGAEMLGMAALLGTLDVYRKIDVAKHLWKYGSELRQAIVDLIIRHGVDWISLTGSPVSLSFVFRDISAEIGRAELRSIFLHEMAARNIVMPWISQSLSHGREELIKTVRVIDDVIDFMKYFDWNDTAKRGAYRPLKPVFRKYN